MVSLDPIGVIILITAFSGLIGGYAAFLIDNRSLEISSDKTSFRTSWPYLILGIIGATCVPLFLSLVKSDLLRLALSSRGSESFENYLVYTGLSVIAAIYARKFISSISEQVLALERKAESAKKEARSVRESVEEIRDVVDEQDAEKRELAEPVPAPAIQFSPKVDAFTTPFAKSIIEKLTHSTFRTPSGIAKEIGLERSIVGDELNRLADQGFVNRTISPKTSGPRFTINEAGIALLGE